MKRIMKTFFVVCSVLLTTTLAGATLPPKQIPINNYLTTEKPLTTLEIKALDTWANDSFDVYYRDTLVYSYIDNEPTNDTPTWITHSINLKYLQLVRTITIKIVSTGGICDMLYDYGLVAVDTMKLYKPGTHISDTVDIGNETSEATHNLTGWGLLEPYLHPSGYWGDVDNCRVVYQQYTANNDEEWATVDFHFVAITP